MRPIRAGTALALTALTLSGCGIGTALGGYFGGYDLPDDAAAAAAVFPDLAGHQGLKVPAPLTPEEQDALRAGLSDLSAGADQ